MSVKAIKIDKIEYGTYGDGVIPTSWTELTDAIVEDSVVFNFSDPTETPLKQETSKNPFHIVLTKEDPDSIEFALYAPSAATLGVLMGGTVSTDAWSEATTIPEIYKSWKISTEESEDVEHVEYTILNGKTYARFDQSPGKKKAETVLVKVIKEAAITALGVENPGFTRNIIDDTP